MESVRRMRREKGLSQQDLADLAGVGQDSISAIETGRHEPHPRTLRKLANALGAEVADFFREPAVPLPEAPREAGQPDEERSVRDIAHAEALRRDTQDRKAARRTLASEGIDHAPRISDVYDPAVYDVLRRQPSDELAGALLDAERDYVHAEQEYDQLQTRVKQEKEANARLREENARLRQDIAELRSEAEREGARR